MGLAYREVFIALADLQGETLVAFYRQFLNQEPTIHLPQVYAEFQLTGLRLGLFTPKATHQLEFANHPSGAMSLCFEVDDLEGAIAHLQAMGYPPPGAISTASHGREIYAYDPSGNRLILHESKAVNLCPM